MSTNTVCLTIDSYNIAWVIFIYVPTGDYTKCEHVMKHSLKENLWIQIKKVWKFVGTIYFYCKQYNL